MCVQCESNGKECKTERERDEDGKRARVHEHNITQAMHMFKRSVRRRVYVREL